MVERYNLWVIFMVHHFHEKKKTFLSVDQYYKHNPYNPYVNFYGEYIMYKKMLLHSLIL